MRGFGRPPLDDDLVIKEEDDEVEELWAELARSRDGCTNLLMLLKDTFRCTSPSKDSKRSLRPPPRGL